MIKRICKICKEEKIKEIAFNRYKYTTIDGITHPSFKWTCKQCANIKKTVWARKDRLNSTDEELENKRKENKSRIRNRKLKAIEYMGGKCHKCNIIDAPCIFDFHHLNPRNKDFNVGVYSSWEKTRKELDKCIMLCSNCHRKEHHKYDD